MKFNFCCRNLRTFYFCFSLLWLISFCAAVWKKSQNKLRAKERAKKKKRKFNPCYKFMKIIIICARTNAQSNFVSVIFILPYIQTYWLFLHIPFNLIPSIFPTFCTHIVHCYTACHFYISVHFHSFFFFLTMLAHVAYFIHVI